MTMGERIKLVRKHNNLNQTEFANLLGISQTHVSKIEKNVENPSETLLLLISFLFAVNIDWLTDEIGDQETNDRMALTMYKLENQKKNLNSNCIFELEESFFYFEKVLSFAYKKYSKDYNYDYDKMEDYIKTFGEILQYMSFLLVDFKHLTKYNTKAISKDDNVLILLRQSFTNFLTEHLNVENNTCV